MRLPSGTWALLRAVNVEDIVLHDLMPKQLRKAVLAGAGNQEQTARNVERMVDDDAAEALTTLTELRDRLAIGRLRAVRESRNAEWEPVPAGMTVDQLPPDDVDALRKIQDGTMTPAMVTAIVQRKLGEISEDEAIAIVDADAARTVEAWDSFRHQRRGAPDGARGGGLAPTPIRADRRQRSGRRARSG